MITNIYKRTKNGIGKLYITGLTYSGIIFFDLKNYNKIKKYLWRADNNSYILACNQNKNRIYLHRYLVNCPKDRIVDHFDRNKFNNLESNLKVVTHVENNANSPKRKDNSTGVVGVKNRGFQKYEAQITFNKQRYTKRFHGENSLDDAIIWRKQMALKFNNKNG